jgi:hypothetical protein
MKVQVTLTQLKTPNGNFTVAGDFWLDGDLELDTTATLLVVRDRRTKIQYITDFASSSVAAILNAAANTGGNFVLT